MHDEANPSLAIAVITPDTLPHWVETLGTEPDFTVTPVPLPHVWDHLATRPVDAFILTDCDNAHRHFLKTLHEQNKGRPAVILGVDTPLSKSFHPLVDLAIAPASHPLLTFQIRHTIHQHRHMQQMQATYNHAMSEVEVMKNAIVHNVSHELNTPLLQVKSAVALIGEDIENSSLVDYAQRATARLEAAIRNITQLAASLDDMQMAPLVIRENIDTALRDVRRTWEHKEHLARIQVSVEDKLPLALGDRHGITIVLQELIDNALKFSRDQVEIRACKQQDSIQILVRDYGIGIDESELKRIFDSFYQVDYQSTRKYAGTGVGLANVRLILERHGTDIKVESQKNKGSTFSFELPIADLNS